MAVTVVKSEHDGNTLTRSVVTEPTAAPAVTDDWSKGYRVGSRWNKLDNDKEYVCQDATIGAAVWVLLN